ncbi:MAG: FixG Ig-like domain-containing protein, partial [Aeromonas veronii]
ENTYTLKILNKTLQSQTYQLDVEGLPEYQWFGPREVTLKAGEIYTLPVSLAVDPYNLKRPALDIQFVLKREGAAPDDSKGNLRQGSKFISRL